MSDQKERIIFLCQTLTKWCFKKTRFTGQILIQSEYRWSNVVYNAYLAFQRNPSNKPPPPPLPQQQSYSKEKLIFTQMSSAKKFMWNRMLSVVHLSFFRHMCLREHWATLIHRRKKHFTIAKADFCVIENFLLMDHRILYITF